MKITDERKSMTKPFIETLYGETFMWHEKVFMRIHTLFNKDNEIIANAVEVKSGEEYTLLDDALVEPLDAELIIRG